MGYTWKTKAFEIGKLVHEASQKHPQLAPLCTSWMNFARKHKLHRQAKEIKALVRHIVTFQRS